MRESKKSLSIQLHQRGAFLYKLLINRSLRSFHSTISFSSVFFCLVTKVFLCNFTFLFKLLVNRSSGKLPFNDFLIDAFPLPYFSSAIYWRAVALEYECPLPFSHNKDGVFSTVDLLGEYIALLIGLSGRLRSS